MEDRHTDISGVERVAVSLDVPAWLGYVWLIGSALGILAAVAGMVLGISFVTEATAASLDALRLTESVFEAVDETGRVLDDTFVKVARGLDTVQISVADASSTLDQMATVTNDLTVLLTEEVPESLDAIHETMPQLIRTAGVIDTTMRALRFVGVDYDPDAPLDDSLVELDQKLSVIPVDLRAQRSSLDQIHTRVGEFADQSRTIASDVGTIRDGLSQSQSVIGEYRSTAAEARALIVDVTERLDNQARAVRWVIIVLSAALIIGQTVPLAAGWWVVDKVRAIEGPPSG